MAERWVYERDLCEVIDRAHPTGKVIAMVTIQDEQQRHRAGGLIAAAPELLEACETVDAQLLWMAERYAESGGDYGPEMRGYREAVAVLRGAIAKARGDGRG
jgi:sulfate adenylyltransferase subunit 1 (EFTu-like GTPase family)